MARVTWVQNNFNGGEWSPLAYGRADLAKYKNGLAKCQNFLPTQQGGLTRRPGTRYVAPVKNATIPPRLIPFEFSITQAYILEVGAGYIRFYANDGQLLTSGVAAYSAGTAYTIGALCTLGGITYYCIAPTTGNAPPNAAYWYPQVGAIFEIPTPYTNAADPWLLSVTQSADVLFIAHPNYPPMELQRFGATDWVLSVCSFLDGPYLSVNTTSTQLTPTLTVAVPSFSANFSGYQMTLTADITGGALAVGDVVTQWFQLSQVSTIQALLSGTANTNGAIYLMSGSLNASGLTGCVAYSGGLAPGQTISVTASSIVGINVTSGNTGTGFQPTDVGRMLRIKCGGLWFWGTIASVLSTTSITWTVGATYADQIPVQATATANISGGSVFTISVINGGSGYGVSPPTVTINGGGGSGAVAYALLTDGVVSSITVSVTGSGYTSAPTVSLSSPSGVVPASTAFWSLGVWNSVNGYPAVCTFHQDRLVWAGCASYPNEVDASNTGDYLNFAPTDQDGTVTDSNALSFTLNSGNVNAIRWMLSDQWGLVIGTAGGEWCASPSNTQQALTPTNLNVVPMSNYGSAPIQPLRVGRCILFIQRTGRKIREMMYQFMLQTFQALDISLVCEHLTKGGIQQLALQLAPQQVVWMATKLGTMVGLTYDKDQDVCGGHEHILGGFSDIAQSVPPVVCSIASIPDPTITRDEVWVVVQRYINGALATNVEVMSKLWEDGDALAACNFLDSSAPASIAGGTTVSGLTWLVGQTVGVLTDGAVHPPCVVSATGTITLQWPANIVQVGLPYTSLAQTLNIEAGGQDGPSQGKFKRIFRAVLRFFQSIGISMGSTVEGANVYPESFRSVSDPMNQPSPLFNGDQRWEYEGDWDDTGMLYFQTSDPLPSNITLAMVQMDTEDAQ